MSRSVVLLVAALLAPAMAGAGAWPIGDGRYYATLQVGRLVTHDLATPAGDTVRIPEYERRELNFYAEYGLSDRWTAILSAPLATESSIRGFGSAYGPGDLAFALQRQLPDRGAWVTAARAMLQAPTGDEQLGRGVLPTGSGVWEGELALSAGRSLGGGRGWISLEGGHRARGGGLTDGFAHRSQLGWHVGRKVYLAWNLSGMEPYSDRGGETGVAAGLGDGVRYLAYGPQLVIGFGRGWAIDAKLEDTARARNLATGVTARLGLSVKR